MDRVPLSVQWLTTLYAADPTGRPVAIALDTVSVIEAFMINSALKDRS